VYKKILVPLDGSELSEAALPFTEKLAGILGSELVLLYVCESSEDKYRRIGESYLEKLIQILKNGAEKHLEKPGTQTLHIKSRILFGSPAEQIVDYAVKSDIDLVVMSTHGQSGIKRWTLGSVSEKVVRAINCPIALIRAHIPLKDIRKRELFNRVLVPLDGSMEAEQAVFCISEIAAKLKMEVILFQVLVRGYPVVSTSGGGGYGLVMYSEQQIESDKVFTQNYLDKIGAQLKPQGVIVKTEIRFGNAAEEIIKYAEELSIDLVAMSTHGRSGIRRWVLGSVAEKVLYEGSSPLLLVPYRIHNQ
jgi:nucleotide-binding universal stress UspA family protein